METIPAFPYAGRARRRPTRNADDHLEHRTLVAYEVDESSGELVVNILGVFHGGQPAQPSAQPE